MEIRARARVDLAALRHNLDRLRRSAPGTELCPVVKADAYGHGIWTVSRELIGVGVERLAVATAEEAVAIREIDSAVSILVLGALTSSELEVAVGVGAEISVWEEGFLRSVSARASAVGHQIRVHLKYDTGMSRLGNRDPEALRAMAEATASDPGLLLEGFWTHFATADDPEGGFLTEQLDRFLEVGEPLRSAHRGLKLHAANSAALLAEPRAALDIARPGIAVYGMDPFGSDPTSRDLVPVLSLSAPIAALRTVDGGDSVGYGRTWIAGEETVIATVPIGYGDGYRRGLSGRAEVLLAGRRHPVVGRVSMDNIAVSLGPPGAADASIGKEVILIGVDGGERVLAEDLAEILDTINYEITCGISPRVPREPTEPRS